jgi:hypothetical protein
MQLVRAGALLAEINDIKSFEVQFEIDIMTEGYVGEFTDRRDDMFKGISGNIEFHIENGAPFDLIQAIVDRAQRRPGANVQFNAQAVLRYPTGLRKKILLNDIYFSSIPLTIGSRSDYITYKVSFEGAEYKFLN